MVTQATRNQLFAAPQRPRVVLAVGTLVPRAPSSDAYRGTDGRERRTPDSGGRACAKGI